MAAAKGGTLYMLNLGPTDHWDPQRIYVGADIQVASRVFERTLTTFPPGATKEEQSKLTARPGHRHGHDVRRRQDVEVHDP